jgi:hypothetical protein
MGNTLKTRIIIDGHSFDGEALLETSEVILRGPKRIVVPFAKIRSIDAHDGQLHLHGDAEIVIELGAQAEAWAEKIRNPKTVVQKLGVKAGQHVSLVSLHDEEFVRDLERAGAVISNGRAKKNSAAIFFGAKSSDELKRLATLRESLAPDGALWVIRPKGVKEITEAQVMAAGKTAGLVDVKVVRFSDTHTAEKFVIPIAQRTR